MDTQRCTSGQCKKKKHSFGVYKHSHPPPPNLRLGSQSREASKDRGQPITHILPSYNREYCFFRPICIKHVITELPLGPIRVRDPPHNPHPPRFSRHHIKLQVSTMEVESQQPNEREGAVSALNTAIEALNLAGDASNVAPAKALFGSVGTTLATIRVSFLLAPC